MILIQLKNKYPKTYRSFIQYCCENLITLSLSKEIDKSILNDYFIFMQINELEKIEEYLKG